VLYEAQGNEKWKSASELHIWGHGTKKTNILLSEFVTVEDKWFLFFFFIVQVIEVVLRNMV
jgi:hypothetical protein